MSLFFRQIYTEAPLTVIGLVIFFAVFVLLFSWVYFRRGAKGHYDQLAQMPLQDEGEVHAR